jgi:hypothetical protein
VSRSGRALTLFAATALIVATMAAQCGGGSVRPDRRPASPAPSTSQFMGTKD